MFNLFKNRKGFTLVELMIVVVIIAILISITIQIFDGAKQRAIRETCFANQRTIEGAAQEWIMGDAFRNVQSLTGEVKEGHVLFEQFDKYLKTVPKCPATDLNYTLNEDGTVKECGMHGHYAD